MSTYQAVRELEAARQETAARVDEASAAKEDALKKSQQASDRYHRAAQVLDVTVAELAKIDAALAVLNRPTNE